MHLAEHAGRVDEAADWAVGGLDIGDAGNDGIFAGDIERGRPKDRLRARERFGGDIGYHHTLAMAGEQRRRCRTDAAAAAGDENDAVSGHGRFPCQAR